jgi:nicotinamide riboside transporter PnuC
MTYLPIDWIAAGLGLAGMWLLPTRRKTAIILFLIGNVLWLAWALQTGSYGVVANYLLMGVLNARTLWTWVRESRTISLSTQLSTGAS